MADSPAAPTPADIRHALDERQYEPCVVFPPDFAARLDAFRSQSGHRTRP